MAKVLWGGEMKMIRVIWGVEVKYPDGKIEPEYIGYHDSKKDVQAYITWSKKQKLKDHNKEYKNEPEHLTWLKELKYRVRQYTLCE